MKRGDKFKVSFAWWDEARPATLPSTGLGAALKAYETAKHKFQEKIDPASHEAAVEALEKVEAARPKAVKLCGPAFQLEKSVLTAGAQEIGAERTRLNGLGEARAKTKLKALEEMIESARQTIDSSLVSMGKIVDKLEVFEGRDTLDDHEREALAATLDSVANTVFFIESAGPRLRGIRDRREFEMVMYFKVAPGLPRELAEVGKEALEGLAKARTLRAVADEIAGRFNTKVKYLATQ